MKLLVICAILSTFYSIVNAQGIKGVITDDKNQPIPFATIYIEDIQSGTTANLNGEYDINVPPGNHSVLYKSLGYKEIKMKIDVPESGKTLNIELKTEVYQLKEVTISAKGEDPAYGIMRKAIALAPYHLRQVKYYESIVYLRGTIYIDKVPRLISKHVTFSDNSQEIKIKTGDVYSEESILDITFNAPRFYKRKVRSMRTSFPGNSSNPVNPIMVIEASFYEPEIMDLVSPLAPEAFQHYKFKYHGFSEEGDYIVDKIQVIPRRKSQELFRGFIYIVEGSWSIHSLDLTVNQFWGNLNIRGVFGKVEQTAWMPISYRFDVNASYLGIKGRYKYSTAVKYTKADLNEKLTNVVKSAPTKVIDEPKPKVSKKTENIKQTVKKEKLTNRDMKKVSKEIIEVSTLQRTDTLTQARIKEMTKRETDSLARKRDSTYWNEFRPVPLTAEEIKSYEEGPSAVIQKVKKDSINLAKDSTYNTKKKRKYPFWVFTGKYFKWNDGNINLNYKGLFQTGDINFNTVDGFRYGLKSDLFIKLDSGKQSLLFKPWVGYAFNRKAFMWEVNLEYEYNKEHDKIGTLKINAGEKSSDFNGVSGISPFVNSISSLFFRENFMKLYNNKFIQIDNYKSVSRFFAFSVNAQYALIDRLYNTTNFSFFNRSTRSYSPNIPENAQYPLFGNEQSKDLKVTFGIYLSPYRKPKGDGYNREYNPFPQISLYYTIGVPGFLNSNTEYQNVSLSANKRYWLGRNRIFKYKVHSTYWLSSKNVPFADFTVINTNYVPLAFRSFDYTYQLLPYYTSNTKSWSVGAHTQYQTKLLVLKRLPIISNRIWTENLYLNYLYTPVTKNYLEAGYSIGQILAVGEVGIFASFADFTYNSVGIKVCLNL